MHYAVLCHTVAKHRLCRVCKRRKSTSFTYDTYAVFLKFDGNKKITNVEVLRRTELITIYFTLSQSRLGYIMKMRDERIPKSMLYSTASWSMADTNVVVQHYVLMMCASAT